MLGDAVWPGFLDRYLARKAIAGQQTGTRANGSRRDNLDAPVTELHRTRGSFSAETGSMAPLVPAEVARVGAVALGAALFFALGATLRPRHH